MTLNSISLKDLELREHELELELERLKDAKHILQVLQHLAESSNPDIQPILVEAMEKVLASLVRPVNFESLVVSQETLMSSQASDKTSTFGIFGTAKRIFRAMMSEDHTWGSLEEVLLSEYGDGWQTYRYYNYTGKREASPAFGSDGYVTDGLRECLIEEFEKIEYAVLENHPEGKVPSQALLKFIDWLKPNFDLFKRKVECLVMLPPIP